jgi:predicted dehydrogenase
MRNGKFGFGLVGVGMGAVPHAENIRELSEGELVAVYGRNEQKAQAFAERFGVKRWYSDYRRLLDDKYVDIVSILTPNSFHREFAVPAAEAGKHVITEKPIDVSLEAANAIIDACRRHKVKLAVIYQMRFGSAVQKVKRVVESGALGKLFLADVYDKERRTHEYYANDYWRGTKQYEGGGSLITQAIHQVDILQWLMGPTRSVFAKTKAATHKIEVEDLAVAVVTFENGALGVIESTTSANPALKGRLEVHGENGTVMVNAQYDQILYWNIEGSPEKVDIPAGFQLTDISDPARFPQVRHRYQFQDMIDAIKENREPVLNGEEGRKSLAIVLAIYKSAETGREVAVEV